MSNLILGVLLFAVFVVVAGILLAVPTMLLWDWLMPAIFGLKTITIWQAWGVNVLTMILFRGLPHAKGEK